MGRFFQLSSCTVEGNKNVVVSAKGDGQFAIAQQLIVEDGAKPMSIFLKNSITTDLSGLERLRDCIEEAIEKAKRQKV